MVVVDLGSGGASLVLQLLTHLVVLKSPLSRLQFGPEKGPVLTLPLLFHSWGGFICILFLGDCRLSCVPATHLPVCPQDEVAHTVTESRVLQNTRHPFLTVSFLSLPTLGQSSGKELLKALLWCKLGRPGRVSLGSQTA